MGEILQKKINLLVTSHFKIDWFSLLKRLPQNPKVQLQKGFPIIPIVPANFTTKSIPVITKLSSVVDDSSSAVNKYSEEQVDQEINTPEKMDAPGEVIDPEQAPVKHSGDPGGGSEELEPDCPA